MGYGRAHLKPAALLCTSGTAVANYFPAIVEAHESHIPLIVITADRPPELQQCMANQTIDQIKIFGDYVHFFFSIPCPDKLIAPEALLTTVDQAVLSATALPRGPVHLNCHFREPLDPRDTGEDFSNYLTSLHRWQNSSEPYTHGILSPAMPAEVALNAMEQRLHDADSGLLIIGQLDMPEERIAARALVAASPWPVFADITSGLRLGPGGPSLIHHYDEALLVDQTAFDCVLHVGGRLTSKRLQMHLKAIRPAAYYLIQDHAFRQDPEHLVSHRIVADIVLTCRALALRFSNRPTHPSVARWKEISNLIAKQLEQHAREHYSEMSVAHQISELIPQGHGLYLAASLAVRHLEMFGSRTGNSVAVCANRGASGIDGTIAAASGYALGLQRPVTLLIGDLALLHDVNSLALLRRSPYPITVVVVNNDGGAIFSFLPIAQFDQIFVDYWETPHGLTFPAAAALFQIPYEAPTTAREFQDIYQTATQSGRSSVIEVASNCAENFQKNRQLQETIKKELEYMFTGYGTA